MLDDYSGIIRDLPLFSCARSSNRWDVRCEFTAFRPQKRWFQQKTYSSKKWANHSVLLLMFYFWLYGKGPETRDSLLFSRLLMAANPRIETPKKTWLEHSTQEEYEDDFARTQDRVFVLFPESILACHVIQKQQPRSQSNSG